MEDRDYAHRLTEVEYGEQLTLWVDCELPRASGVVEKTLGNCGVGLDGRFFHIENGKVVLNSSGSW